ncbi:MAG: hypothetical protein GKR98_09080 [Boseongicola sp.]|nr:MAG: hypothetical protein GKR98_09080 [Boseongicola sp.]
MDVTEILNEMRIEASGCDLVAFADLSSRMMLCVSPAGQRPQEELDVLTEVAAASLSGPLAESAAPLLDARAPVEAIALTSIDARIFLKPDADASEALICICAPDANIEKILSCGRDALGRIVANG